MNSEESHRQFIVSYGYSDEYKAKDATAEEIACFKDVDQPEL